MAVPLCPSGCGPLPALATVARLGHRNIELPGNVLAVLLGADALIVLVLDPPSSSAAAGQRACLPDSPFRPTFCRGQTILRANAQWFRHSDSSGCWEGA